VHQVTALLRVQASHPQLNTWWLLVAVVQATVVLVLVDLKPHQDLL
jgi:hypothetical protein